MWLKFYSEADEYERKSGVYAGFMDLEKVHNMDTWYRECMIEYMV